MAGGAKVRIERTKNEAFFADFRHADSNSAKIVGLVASNPLLTLPAFLHPAAASVSADDKAGLVMPLILDPAYKFTSSKDRSGYRAQHEKLGKMRDKAGEAVRGRPAAPGRIYGGNGDGPRACKTPQARPQPPPTTFAEIKDAALGT